MISQLADTNLQLEELTHLQTCSYSTLANLGPQVISTSMQLLVKLLSSENKFIAYSASKACCHMLCILPEADGTSRLTATANRIIDVMICKDTEDSTLPGCLDVLHRTLTHCSQSKKHGFCSLMLACICQHWPDLVARCLFNPDSVTASQAVMQHSFLRLWNKCVKMGHRICCHGLESDFSVLVTTAVPLWQRICSRLSSMCWGKALSVLCNCLPSYLIQGYSTKSIPSVYAEMVVKIVDALRGEDISSILNTLYGQNFSCFGGQDTSFVKSYSEVHNNLSVSASTCSTQCLEFHLQPSSAFLPNVSHDNDTAPGGSVCNHGNLRRTVLFMLKVFAVHSYIHKDCGSPVLSHLTLLLDFVESKCASSPWQLWLYLDQDDLLMDANLCLHSLYTLLKARSKRDAVQSVPGDNNQTLCHQSVPGDNNQTLCHQSVPGDSSQTLCHQSVPGDSNQTLCHQIAIRINAHRMLVEFIVFTAMDPSLLCDLLTSPETCFLAYFTKALRLMRSEWNEFCDICQRFSQSPMYKDHVSKSIPGQQMNNVSPASVSPKKPGLVDYEDTDSDSSREGSDVLPYCGPSTPNLQPETGVSHSNLSTSSLSITDTKEQAGCRHLLDDVMSVFIRLRFTVEALHESGIFPYSPRPLLNLLTDCEKLYEE